MPADNFRLNSGICYTDGATLKRFTVDRSRKEQAAAELMISTFWLSFNDNGRFLGVAIFDMVETEDARLEIDEIVERAWELGINPGGAVCIQDVSGYPSIKPEHKNRLIIDDALLIELGSKGRKVKH